MESLQEEWIRSKNGAFEDRVPFVVWLCEQVIALRQQAAQQSVQADTRRTPEGTVVSDDVIPF